MVISAIPIKKQIDRLCTWREENGFLGWDPYDIQTHPLYKSVVRKAFSVGEFFFPKTVRFLLKIHPKINAKGLGLFLTSYATLFQATNDPRYLNLCKEIVQLLQETCIQTKHGVGWGYPFNWNSVQFIPKNTPSAVVTYMCGEGLLKFYEITNDSESLKLCKQICEFFIRDLKRTYQSDEAVCFSYTPIDDYQVHNANLFVAAFLTKMGHLLNQKETLSLGILAGNFALQQQQKEGFLPYWGLDQTHSHSNGQIKVDHYHSGFEIRMLHQIATETKREDFRKAYQKYYSWYLKNLFNDAGEVLFTPENKYPINIHSIAEAILCQTILLEEYPERLPSIESLIKFTEQTLEYAPGQYCYLIKKFPLFGEKRAKIPMIRWGQAWMLRALSELYKQLLR